MAGRKHHLQQMGVQVDKGFNHIKDPVERDMAFKSIQAVPYCKHCGRIILQAFQDEHGQLVDAEWEMQNLTHYKCHLNWESDEREKAAKLAKEEEEKKANFDWEKYMQDMMGKRGE